MKRWNDILWAVLLVAGASGWFLMSTVLVDEAPDAVVVAASAFAAFVLVLVSSPPSRGDLSQGTPRGFILSALAGVSMLCVSPLLVLGNRLTDAPPGAETLFLTTSAWALLALVVGAFVHRQRPSLTQMSLVAAGVLGGAALLANWERPSSFSPFVRYPSQETAFLLAGVLWCLGALILAWQLSKPATAEARSAVFVAAASGLVSAGAYLLFTEGVSWLQTLNASPAALLSAAVAYALTFGSWTLLASRRESLPTTAALLLLPPVVITGFGAFEQFFSPRGPDPVIWPGAFGGIALALVGSLGARLLAGPLPATRPGMRVPRLPIAAIIFATAALAAGIIGLGFPAMTAAVRGSLTNGEAYSASWSMLGYETVAGWLPLVGALLLAAGSLEAIRLVRPLRTLAIAASATFSLGLYPVLASTPLHTWTRWVPVEIQSDYGTEYALLQFAVVHNPLRLIALGLAAISAILLVMAALFSLKDRKPLASPEVF